MPKVSLTDKKLRSLRSGQDRVEYWDKSLSGFGVRITRNGEKTFCMMYRIGGKLRRYTLGRYPQLSLATAREMAKDAFEAVRKGKDPVQEKKATEARAHRERIEAKTFGQLAQTYLEEYAKLNKKSWEEDERLIKRILKPEFGTLDVKQISRSHVRSFLRSVAAKTNVQANRAHACLRKILNWAIKEEIVDLEANPASGISSPGGRERPKERTLTDEELKAVWRELESETSQVKDVLRLILLTGQRPGEVMGMRWDEIDFNESLWTIPGSRTKNGLTQVVPLSAQALRIIERQRQTLEAQQQIRQERGDPAPQSPFIFPNRHLARYSQTHIRTVQKTVETVRERLGIQSFSAHDFRRTCATRLGKMQVPGHIIARILNHKPKDITNAVYNQYDYLKEKREALADWGSTVARVVSDLELVKPGEQA